MLYQHPKLVLDRVLTNFEYWILVIFDLGSEKMLYLGKFQSTHK